MQRTLLIVLWGLLPLSALADGKVFSSRTALAEISMPDQRALICWSNGVERLVIETRFAGAGTNFAWVVPLPAVPEIEAATSGLFATLAYQLRPELIHAPLPWCSAFLFCIAMGWLIFSVAQSGELGTQGVLACLLAGASAIPMSLVAALFLTLFLLWASERVVHGHSSFLELLVVLLLISLLSAMLLPGLGTAGMSSVSGSDVTELQRARVGTFETVTITAKSSDGLMNWLQENEFVVSTNIQPVVADYLTRGWVFVASKLAREHSVVATNAIHPLSFTFKTAEAVYPMQLTGVDAGPLHVELYVFGQQQAAADHFSATACVSALFPEEARWRSRLDNNVQVMHPLLRAWAMNYPVITKLTGRLLPEQMQQDVVLRWEKFVPQRAQVHSRRGAFIVAANWATGLGFAALLLVLLDYLVRRRQLIHLPKIALGVVAVAALVLMGIYLSLPKVRVRSERFLPALISYPLRTLGQQVQMKWQEKPPGTLAEARKAVVLDGLGITNNVLLGGVMREEDSPGNYVIRQSADGFEFIWYDANGAEQRAAVGR